MLPYVQAKKSLSPKEKIGQFFMPAAFINDSIEEIQKLEELIRRHHVGGICFFHSRASAATNYEADPKSKPGKVIPYNQNSLSTLKTRIERYQAASKYPLLVSIDAEWGLAMRVENTPQYPYSITLGAIQDNLDLIFAVGQNIARDCKAAGIHWNLAPVVDINNNPENPVIGYRSFGENRELVLAKARVFLNGTQSEGVLTSIKHFPGHGDTATDSHLGLPLINKSKQELFENELYPFQRLIDEGVDCVMVGHLSVPELTKGKHVSSSVSKDVIKGFLRKKMGFEGVVISDALNMHAVSKDYPTKGELEWSAFEAGNDILCFSENPEEGIAYILKNSDAGDIEKSFQRIWRLKEKVFKTNTSPTPSSGSQTPRGKTEVSIPKPFGHTELNIKLAQKSLTQLKGTEAVISEFKKKGFFGITVSPKRDNLFFESIQGTNRFNWISSQDFSIPKRIDQINKHENVLISLVPPQVKPTNDFGIPKEELQFINTLLKTRNVVLYLFGNPYVLDRIHIQKALGVVVAFQDFKEFQQVAAQHFLGTLKAKGKLPVTLKNAYESS